MVDDKMEDETYSLIFTAIRHPIHRRILRMLVNNPLTHSEILDTLSIDSERLTKHLESLGDLTLKDKNGRYHLSSFGRAAVMLMCGVEEHSPISSQCLNRPHPLISKAYSIILVLVLVCASAYAISYVAAVPDASQTTRWAFTLADYSIGVGETLDLNFTLTELASNNGHQSIGVTVGSSQSKSLIPRENSFTGWYEDSIWVEMEPRKCYAPRDLIYIAPEDNATTPTFTDYSGVFWQQLETMNFSETSYVVVDFSPDLGPIIRFSPDLASTINTTIQTSELANFYLVYFPRLSVNFYTPDGTTISDFIQRKSEPYFTVTSFSPSQLYWISESSNATSFSSSIIPISQLGVYNLQITNNGPFRWDENFSLYLKSQRMERPYFYLGIAILVALLGYIVFVTVGRIRRNRSMKVY